MKHKGDERGTSGLLPAFSMTRALRGAGRSVIWKAPLVGARLHRGVLQNVLQYSDRMTKFLAFSCIDLQ
jgi:hypothetical protein